jgi:hypothetical protein
MLPSSSSIRMGPLAAPALELLGVPSVLSAIVLLYAGLLGALLALALVLSREPDASWPDLMPLLPLDDLAAWATFTA